ncbi:hypothetical protein [Sporocytophaga myxococcoides]|uniref:hypothetical protein n=1 Tax=Sporocytophaga myxococcoides TaxID=153721 RepID=UPI0005EE5E88|nr:hypothetical protein [Sporocytophaga myxococcoides]
MNRIFLKLLQLFIITFLSCKGTQKTTSAHIECKQLAYDIHLGEINGVKPDLSQNDIKEWFPCYTSVVADGSDHSCGGAIIYNGLGFTYYTYWDFVEVNKTFKGEVAGKIFEKTRKEIREELGSPVDTKYKEERPEIDFYPSTYGCIRIEYSNNRPFKVASHFNDCDQIELCD